MQFEARRPPARCDLLRCWRMATGAGSDDDSDGERDSSFCLPSAAGSSAPWASAPIAVRERHSSGAGAASPAGVAGGSGFARERFGDHYDLGPIIGRGSTSTFATEIAALRSCHHPNIIRLEDAIITDGCLYLVLEHLRGGELFDYVVARGTLSEAEASGILRDLASAVRYMHAKGIIHRDLKPENLLLTREPPPGMVPEVKIIDFGLSKMLTEPSSIATSFLGTRGYLAPEMLKRQHYSKAVDMWAFGVIAYILLCGCLPFDDDSAKVSSPLLGRKFELRYPSWAQSLSAGAKSFLAALLDVDPKRRATAAKILDHPWLRGDAAAATSLLRSPAMLRHVPRTPKAHRPPPPPAATSRPPAHRAQVGVVRRPQGRTRPGKNIDAHARSS
ncbi:serine/threonine kinase [Aureococcus anophagefferens]|nr:serine/threonine kinase [Aureococcus anophagefferens]